MSGDNSTGGVQLDVQTVSVSRAAGHALVQLAGQHGTVTAFYPVGLFALLTLCIVCYRPRPLAHVASDPGQTLIRFLIRLLIYTP